MTTREHEQTLNVRLSDELRARGLGAKPEVSHPGNRRIDVEVRIGPARIAVEAEHGQSRHCCPCRRWTPTPSGARWTLRYATRWGWTASGWRPSDATWPPSRR